MILFFWIGLGIAFIFGLLHPFAERLQCTSLWVGKVLVPTELSSAYPSGLQAALTNGWPSTYIVVVNFLPYVSSIIAFFYVWWAALIVFIISAFFSAIFGKTQITSHKVERYIAILIDHIQNEIANYKKRGDFDRSEASENLNKELAELLILYLKSEIRVPTMKQAKAAPYGDRYYLLNLYS
ncbi:MAG: hypothetical protein WDM71_06445 [Ferruginibacter sp.]